MPPQNPPMSSTLLFHTLLHILVHSLYTHHPNILRWVHSYTCYFNIIRWVTCLAYIIPILLTHVTPPYSGYESLKGIAGWRGLKVPLSKTLNPMLPQVCLMFVPCLHSGYVNTSAWNDCGRMGECELFGVKSILPMLLTWSVTWNYLSVDE